MEVDRESIGGLTAEVDPTLSTSDQSGSFLYSPGITPAPEAAPWVMLAVGGALLGASLRTRRVRRSDPGMAAS